MIARNTQCAFCAGDVAPFINKMNENSAHAGGQRIPVKWPYRQSPGSKNSWEQQLQPGFEQL